MKISTPFLVCVALWCTPLFSQQKISFNQQKTKFSISESSLSGLVVTQTLHELQLQPEQTPRGEFISLICQQGIKSQKAGHPDLPQLKYLIEIPEGSTPLVEVSNVEEEVIDLSQYTDSKVIPAQLSLRKDIDQAPFRYHAATYEEDVFVSDALAAVEINGRMREHTIGTLIISPYKYNPVTNTLIVTTSMTVSVRFENVDFEGEARKMNYASTAFDASFGRLINSSALQASQRDAIVTYPTKYVIVADRMFEDVLQPFVAWKTKKGFNVVEAYTDDPTVGNTTGSIKAYLEGLYMAGTSENPSPSYVIFVGDVDQVPSFSSVSHDHVTDLYYCEYDGDGDYFPEVYYGRFSANNVDELQPQIEKTLEYEQYLFPDDSFLEDVVLVAGWDAYMAATHGNGQINYGTLNYFNSENGVDAHVWLYPESSYNAASIIDRISQGASFANYTAHCSSYGWSDPSFSVNNLGSLNNEHKYPTIIGNCCQSNKFDDAVCFGEALLRAEDKGAIGYIGGSNNTYWDEDFYWAVGNGSVSANPTYSESDLGAYDCLFHSNGEAESDWYYTQGQMIFSGNMAVTQAGGSLVDYYWEIYHLMGDPSLMTYIGMPAEMNVSHDEAIYLGSNSLEVTAESHAYVAVSQNGVLLDAQYTGDQSSVMLNFSSISMPDMLDVVVTKQNRQPYLGTVEILVDSLTPYVILSSNQHDDATGNGNGVVDYSELISLDLDLKNVSQVIANNVAVELSTTDEYVTIVDDSALLVTLDAGAQQMISESLIYEVSGTIPDQHLIEFNVTISSTNGNTWSGSIFVTANAPKIQVLDWTIIDSPEGNGSNYMDAGETVNLEIRSVNNGHAGLSASGGVLTSTSPEVTIVQGTEDFGFMEVGDTAIAVYQVSIDPSTPYGTVVSFDNFCGNEYYSGTKNFLTIVGRKHEDFESGDFSMHPWVLGSSPWTVVSNGAYEGEYCSKSGLIDHYESSAMSITLDVLIPGEVSFMHRESSEYMYDLLEFYIDNELLGEWSGENPWMPITFEVASGVHNLTWKYVKDATESSGEDAVWVDYVVLPIFEPSTSNLENLESSGIHFSVYPNPANHEITVLMNHPEHPLDNTITLRDMRGRVLLERIADTQVYTLDLTGIASGSYLLEIEQGGSVEHRRIVKR